MPGRVLLLKIERTNNAASFHGNMKHELTIRLPTVWKIVLSTLIKNKLEAAQARLTGFMAPQR